jgi:hypothetical protein
MGKSLATTVEWLHDEGLAVAGRRKLRTAADDGGGAGGGGLGRSAPGGGGRATLGALGGAERLGSGGAGATRDGRPWERRRGCGEWRQAIGRSRETKNLNFLWLCQWPPKIRLFSAAVSVATENNLIFCGQRPPPKIAAYFRRLSPSHRK